MSEPQYDDQGAPAQDVPDADPPGDPDPESSGIDEGAPEGLHHEGSEGGSGGRSTVETERHTGQ